mgnify:CR=1 FL=1
MKIILVIGLVISAIVGMTEALRCLPCKLSRPPCVPLYKLNCKGGLVKDVCGCCAICAKLKGEKCGGPWDILGKCDCGLTCYKSPTVIAQMGEFNARGKCIKGKKGK